MKKLFLFFLLTISIAAAAQQEVKLALQYYNNGEFEKAAKLYEKLYADNPNLYYKQYYSTLLGNKNFDVAEALVKQQSKKQKQQGIYLLDLGYIYEQNNQPDKANEFYEKALKNVDPNEIPKLANAFADINLPEKAISLYLKGQELLKDPKAYSFDLANLYLKQGNTENAIKAFLDYATPTPEYNPNAVQFVKNNLQKIIIGSQMNMDAFQTELYARIQKEPSQSTYPELLTWALMQQKNFEDAYIQVKALDRMQNENGKRLIQFAAQVRAEGDFTIAALAYKQILDMGEDKPYFLQAQIAYLETLQEKMSTTGQYTIDEVNSLEQQYLSFIDKHGKKSNTLSTIRDLAHLYAYYLNNLEKAINLLLEVVNMPGADQNTIANCKLDLGDYYLMKDEIWEATLLYSQVDKAHKDDELGELARFKNAKLSYYNGDFEWAQAQLDVLKASTSELIANDALWLSVFITDKTGLDTTTTPLEMYARADLLIVQNKIDQALKTLDSIDRKYPKGNLKTAILYTRAKIDIKQKEFNTAIDYLADIIKADTADILADDALFLSAEVYEKHLNNKEKAMENYQKIITNYTNSLYAVEARKRFRALRGS